MGSCTRIMAIVCLVGAIVALSGTDAMAWGYASASASAYGGYYGGSAFASASAGSYGYAYPIYSYPSCGYYGYPVYRYPVHYGYSRPYYGGCGRHFHRHWHY